MLSPVLRTARLELRTLDPDALEPRYLAWLHDPRVNRYLESRHQPQTWAGIQAFVRAVNESGDSVMYGLFVQGGEPAQPRRHIGNIKLGPIDRRYARGEIGLLIGEESEWGKGYAAEAIAAVTDHALGALGLHKVSAGCYAANEGSRRAFLAAGYREVGRRRDHWLVDGEWMDDVLLERVAR